MKKRFAIVFLILGVGFGLTYLLPGSSLVERSITIELPREDIFSYLVNLEASKDWSPWMEKDPKALFSFHGIPGVVGCYIEWNGSNIGSGKQTLTALDEPSYVEYKLHFDQPIPSEATAYFKLADASTGGVLLTWGLRTDNSNALLRIMGLFTESMIGPDFEKGLQNLKELLEKNQETI